MFQSGKTSICHVSWCVCVCVPRVWWLYTLIQEDSEEEILVEDLKDQAKDDFLINRFLEAVTKQSDGQGGLTLLLKRRVESPTLGLKKKEEERKAGFPQWSRDSDSGYLGSPWDPEAGHLASKSGTSESWGNSSTLSFSHSLLSVKVMVAPAREVMLANLSTPLQYG